MRVRGTAVRVCERAVFVLLLLPARAHVETSPVSLFAFAPFGNVEIAAKIKENFGVLSTAYEYEAAA